MVSEQVLNDVDNEMQEFYQAALNLTPGTVIQRNTHASIQRLFGTPRIEGVDRRNRPSATAVSNIYAKLFETRAGLRPFIAVERNPEARPLPASLAGLPMIGTPPRARTTMGDLVRDPASPAAMAVLFYLNFLESRGRITPEVLNAFSIPTNSERAALRQLLRIKREFDALNTARDFFNLGEEGEIDEATGAVTATNPVTGNRAQGKALNIQQQIGAKIIQINALRAAGAGAPPPPLGATTYININTATAQSADTSGQIAALNQEIANLRTQLGDIETKRTQLQTRLRNFSGQLPTALVDVTGARTFTGWTPGEIETMATNFGPATLANEFATAGMEVSFMAGVTPLADALQDDADILREARFIDRRPTPGPNALFSSSFVLDEILDAGFANVQYGDDQERRDFLATMKQRFLADGAGQIATQPVAGGATTQTAQPGAAPTTPAAAPQTPAGQPAQPKRGIVGGFKDMMAKKRFKGWW